MLYRFLGVITWRFARRYLRQRSRRALPGRRAGAGLLTAALAIGGTAFARSRRAGRSAG